MLTALRDVTGECAQLYRRQGDQRICVAAAERPSGLRDTVPVGSTLTMKAGSAAQILLAWEEPERLHRGLQGARFTATDAVRRTPPGLGAEHRRARAGRRVGVRAGARRRPAGSSPRSRSPGPIERLTRQPGRMHAAAVMSARRPGSPRCCKRAQAEGVPAIGEQRASAPA